MKSPNWTTVEDAALLDPSFATDAERAAYLGRSVRAVESRRLRLGIPVAELGEAVEDWRTASARLREEARTAIEAARPADRNAIREQLHTALKRLYDQGHARSAIEDRA